MIDTTQAEKNADTVRALASELEREEDLEGAKLLRLVADAYENYVQREAEFQQVRVDLAAVREKLAVDRSQLERLRENIVSQLTQTAQALQ
jgi:hypothetical protein